MRQLQPQSPPARGGNDPVAGRSLAGSMPFRPAASKGRLSRVERARPRGSAMTLASGTITQPRHQSAPGLAGAGKGPSLRRSRSRALSLRDCAHFSRNALAMMGGARNARCALSDRLPRMRSVLAQWPENGCFMNCGATEIFLAPRHARSL